MTELEPRAWRALTAMALAVVVVAVVGAVYLRPWQWATGTPAPAPRPTFRFNASVQEAQFLSPALGWVVTSGPSTAGLYRTTDGGRHWQRQLTSVYGPVGAVRFFDARRGVVYTLGPGGPALWRTRDGGQHWTRGTMPDQVPPPLVFFVDPDHGWCLALPPLSAPYSPIVDRQEVTVLRTTDGGATWTQVLATSARQPVSRGLGDEGRKNWIWFRDRDTGWIGQTTPGAQTVVYATADGGDDWTRQELPTPGAEPAGRMEGTAGTALGPPVAIGRSGVALVVSRIVPVNNGWTLQGDSLFTWQPATAWSGPVPVPPGTFSSATFGVVDDRRWWVAAGDSVQLTDDAGGHWRPVGQVPVGFVFRGLSLLDARHAWATLLDTRSCVAGGLCQGSLAQTADGGRHWTLVHPPP